MTILLNDNLFKYHRMFCIRVALVHVIKTTVLLSAATLQSARIPNYVFKPSCMMEESFVFSRIHETVTMCLKLLIYVRMKYTIFEVILNYHKPDL